MLKNSIYCCAAAACLLGLTQGASQPFTNVTITSSDVQRYYLITFPPSFDKAVSTPLILNYHGGTRTAKSQYELSQMSNTEFNDFAVVVYPQGIDEVWEGIPGSTANDLQLTSDIIDSLSSQYTIDASRVWATGKSDGGGFCNTLACDPVLSTKIAAFAPVSAAVYLENTTVCNPETINLNASCHPGRSDIPMLEFHGGNDTTIAYGGGSRKGECVPAIPHWIRGWADRDGLGVKNQTSPLTEDTVVYKWGQGSEEGLVQHVFDKTIGHDWPSTVANADNSRAGHSPASFNATPIILEYFVQHVLSS